jgi:hypothetical protein
MMDTSKRDRSIYGTVAPMGGGHIAASRLPHHIHHLPLLLTQTALSSASENWHPGHEI